MEPVGLSEQEHRDALDACLRRMGCTRHEVDARVAAGDWHVWTAWVYPPSDDGPARHWSFLNDFACVIPRWLDIESDPDASPGDLIARARLRGDVHRCHGTSARALKSRADGYDQAFRVRVRDGSLVWLRERVHMVTLRDDSFYLIGVCTPAEQSDIDAALARTVPPRQSEPAIPEDNLDDIDPAVLRRNFAKLRRDVNLLVRSGQWLIWSAVVRRMREDPPEFHWGFRSDFGQFFPDWFDVERLDGEDLAVTLGYARLEDDDRACSENSVRAILGGSTGYSQMFRVLLRDGRVSWVEENVAIQSISEGVWHLCGVCIDATERKRAEDLLLQQNEDLQNMQAELEAQNEELQQLRASLENEKQALAVANERLTSLAATDGMTGVKNYRAFREQLDVELHGAARYGSALSLLLLDLDHFKQLNDRYGHPAGDSVLVEFARILQDNARECDFVARYGGEEFVVILPRTDASGALALAERYRMIVEAAAWQYSPVTVSIGLATAETLRDTSDTLIERADTALYQAKAAGRNRVVTASLPVPVDKPAAA